MISFASAALIAGGVALLLGMIAGRILPKGKRWLAVAVAAIVGAVLGALTMIPDWDAETTAVLTGYTLGAAPLIVALMAIAAGGVMAGAAGLLAVLTLLAVRPRTSAGAAILQEGEQ